MNHVIICQIFQSLTSHKKEYSVEHVFCHLKDWRKFEIENLTADQLECENDFQWFNITESDVTASEVLTKFPVITGLKK